MYGLIDVPDHLQLFKPEGVPQADCPILADGYDLLLLVVDEDIEDVFALMRLSLVSDAESMRIDRQHQAFGSASDHDSEGGGDVEGANTRMLVVAPALVVVLPDLIEVEGVEELDRPVERRDDQSNVLHVPELRDGVLGCLVSVQGRLSRLAIFALLPCGHLSSICPIESHIVILSADILERIF